jgi:hypothetical protein
MTKFNFEQWSWMMDYCRKKRIPPAQEWAWNKALEEWNNLQMNSLGLQHVLEVDGMQYTKKMIADASKQELHMLCSFCEEKRFLEFIQEHTTIEFIKIYIDNLLEKIS